MDDEFDGLNDIGSDSIEQDISGLDSLEAENDIELTYVSETDDISESTVDELAGLDIDEPVSDELEGSDSVDYSADRDPQMDMAEYMAEHNYGKDDYAEYSQDPEYQEINDRLLEKDSLNPVEYATIEMPDNEFAEAAEETAVTPEETGGEFTDEMPDNEFTESTEGTAETPEETGGEFTDEMPDNEFTESAEETAVTPEETGGEFTDEMPYNEFTESTEEPAETPEETDGEFTDEMPDNEFTESAEETAVTPEETGGEFTDEMPDNEFTESAEETAETPEETGSELTDEMPDNNFTEAVEEIAETSNEENSELSEEELHENNEETNMSPEDIPNNVDTIIPDINHYTDELADETKLPGDFSGFVDDSEFEDLVKADTPEYYESGNFYDQGINEYGFEGTCGPTSQANAINALLGTNEMTENKVLTVAVENELCETKSIDPADNGSTGTEDFMKLYEKVNEKIGNRLSIECFDYDKALSVDEMADKLDEGSVLNIAVDSATLWNQNEHIPGELAEDVCTDHWITVTGVDRDTDGKIIGFNIIDSGGGESYADIEKYERMCFGESGREMIDPTCIVVSKNVPVDTGESE